MKKYGWGYLVPLGGDKERFNEIVQSSLETHSRYVRYCVPPFTAMTKSTLGIGF
jgi:hypothetical protein